MTERPRLRCEHMQQNPDQLSMYHYYEKGEQAEYCLPCIVAIYRRTHDPALTAGVLMERYANAGRVLTA